VLFESKYSADTIFQLDECLHQAKKDINPPEMPLPNHNRNFSSMGFSFRRKDFSIKYRMVRNGQILYSVPFADIAASRLVMRGEGIVEASYQLWYAHRAAWDIGYRILHPVA
jgi:hypothetical protein